MWKVQVNRHKSSCFSSSESVFRLRKALEAALVGRTSFAIAHRLSTIQGCDVILVNADGRVVESGTHQELMALKGTANHVVSLGVRHKKPGEVEAFDVPQRLILYSHGGPGARRVLQAADAVSEVRFRCAERVSELIHPFFSAAERITVSICGLGK